jgi:uncharacterized spore protein YtfJ
MEIQELLGRMTENLSVRRSFGTAYEREGVLIIPVALVVGGGGGGEGPLDPATTGKAPAIEAAPAPALKPAGPPPTGAGGGFGGVFLPMGVYVVKGDQVRWAPAYDANLIILAGLSVLRLVVGLWRGRRRRGRG